ncbi:MAG TPA: type I-D CRISPR-associated helicase Cas3' [Ktedonobacteraceae bacterium]|nr:type I-D CRISPR-associated helicase Cas3' [Ktedonobacteraceae bacterium]
MISLILQSHEEEVWLDGEPFPKTFPPGSGLHPLYHQWLTSQAEGALIINSFNTGTGKTKATFLRLLERVRTRGGQLDPTVDNVLLIAPTNELLAQHAKDAEDFCKKNDLPYRVLSMSRASLNDIARKPGFSENKLRPGAALHSIMEDPRRAYHDRENQATIFVVNPDIFYYALYFRYHRYDRIPLFQDILTACNFIVIDEFHYYNPKQLANFLFFMLLSKQYGFVDGSTRRQFCLLTATPTPQVSEYLQRLAFSTDLIDPAHVPPAPPGSTRKVPALAPVHLEIYRADELHRGDQGEVTGLIALVDLKCQDIVARLAKHEDGAIISSSLWRIEQVYKRLLPLISPAHMGRITGPEKRAGRARAALMQLILATPTVDIGYNFNKDQKTRQAIDFLFFDARSSDEFIQRLGRAGRILGKADQASPSWVYAIVDPTFYKALEAYQGQTLSRMQLRELAEKNLPPRNDLYAYVESGAVAEAFLPLFQLKMIEESERETEIQHLFESVQALFKGDSRLTYTQLCSYIRHFLHCEQQYASLETMSAEQIDLLHQVIVQRGQNEATWLEGFARRLQEEQARRRRKQEPLWKNPQEAFAWAMSDLRQYVIEKARFSFREYFQAPQALISDPAGLHTSDPVTCDDALRIVRFYHARYFPTRQEWEQHVRQKAPEESKDAILFCHLYALRDPHQQLRIGFKLDEGSLLRKQWERIHTRQLTALHGLEIVALNTSQGIPPDIQLLLSERFIPALVIVQQSQQASSLWQLQKRAQFIPYPLHITFGDDERTTYWVVFGTMALLLWAEMSSQSEEGTKKA